MNPVDLVGFFPRLSQAICSSLVLCPALFLTHSLWHILFVLLKQCSSESENRVNWNLQHFFLAKSTSESRLNTKPNRLIFMVYILLVCPVSSYDVNANKNEIDVEWQQRKRKSFAEITLKATKSTQKTRARAKKKTLSHRCCNKPFRRPVEIIIPLLPRKLSIICDRGNSQRYTERWRGRERWKKKKNSLVSEAQRHNVFVQRFESAVLYGQSW